MLPNSVFEDGQDFVAFLPSSSSSPPPERQREKRKAQFGREGDQAKEIHAGGMVFDFSDNVVNPSNRGHGTGVSRKAPWVTDVDWKRCKNVPEM
jgi:hypothetical protein